MSTKNPDRERGPAHTQGQGAARNQNTAGRRRGSDPEPGPPVVAGVSSSTLHDRASAAPQWCSADAGILGTSKELLKSALHTTRERTLSTTSAVEGKLASASAADVLGSLHERAGSLQEKLSARIDAIVKGDPVQVLSQTGVWRDCRVVEREELHGAVKVHYEGFDPMW